MSESNQNLPETSVLAARDYLDNILEGRCRDAESVWKMIALARKALA